MRYTEEHIQFLRNKANIPGMSNKTITHLFNEEFGTNQTYVAITSIRCDKGIILNNKAAKVKRGNKGSDKSLPLGSESTICGKVLIKVEEPDVWKLKQRVIWENYYNTELQPNELIIFLDNNNKNFNINNLALVDRREHLALNKSNYRTENRDLTSVGINMVRIDNKIRDLRDGI